MVNIVEIVQFNIFNFFRKGQNKNLVGYLIFDVF